MAQINKPNQYFNTKLYTGTSATHNITGLDFAPDFVWLKSRTQGGVVYNGMNFLFDTIRGATKRLRSNDASAEAISSASLTSFNSDGYTLGTDDIVNYSGDSFVGWSWLAGGTASSNTQGTITSTVSANTTSGFSIVSYTGTGSASTIGHGLNSAPKMVIVKDRDNGVYSWHVYHVGVGATKTLYLDLTNTPSTDIIYWNNTAPTSSVFSVGTSVTTNTNGNNYIAYCFADVKGFSKFGSYTGNGSTDGTFIYTGFKPAMVIVKSSSAVESWYTYDTKRTTSNGGNAIDKYLLPNQSIAEGTFGAWDFLSNGFKARQNWSGNNSSGVTYIYMAFAENPLVGTNNIPATAR